MIVIMILRELCDRVGESTSQVFCLLESSHHKSYFSFNLHAVMVLFLFYHPSAAYSAVSSLQLPQRHRIL